MNMKAWIARRYSGYTSDGKFWLTIGFAILTVDMAIGFLAGQEQGTFWHGVGYAALAASFAFLPDAAYEEYEHRRIASALVLAMICVPIGIKAYEQQLTYSTGIRQGEVQAAGVQNMRFDGAQDDVKRNRDELSMLMSVLDAAKREAPWAATVKASALREQAATLEAAIKEEGSPRNGGCKRKCLDLMAQKAAVDKQIGGAEKVERAEVRIAELQAIIDKKREIANSTEHRQSLNADIAQTTARLVQLMGGASPRDAIETDDVAIQYAMLGSAGLGSLALLVLAPVCFFLAGRRRITVKPDDPTPSASAPITPVGEIGNRNPETRAYPRHSSPILSTQTVAQLRAMAA